MNLANVGIIFLSILQTIGAIFMSLIYALEALVLCCIPRSFRRADITGKIALITGAGSGIGRRVAQRLAKRGAIIVSWDVSQAGNEETQKIIQREGGKCYIYTVDLCDRNAIYKSAESVKKEVGKVDILVNNAGICTGKYLLESPDEMIQRTFDVNVMSHFWTAKAFLPGMIAEDSGHIVTIASLAGLFGINKLVDYCSSKFAAVGFDEALRMELHVLGHKGIHTTVVCPYYINTGMFDGVESRLLPILEQEYVADEITDAILINRVRLIMPWICKVLFVLKNLVVPKTHFLFWRAFELTDTMDTYVGRQKMD